MSNDKDFKVKNGIQPTAYHEAVGTVVSGSEPYSLAGASYDSVSFSVAAQEITPKGIFFKPDGTKMYVIGSTGDDVNEYDLSTPWDVSTAVFNQLFSVAAQETFPTNIFFKPDGTKMYVIGSTGDNVNEYDLSTPWDISTATFLQLFSLAAQDTSPQGIFFKPDGTKVYVIGTTGDAAYEYDLSTPWDVSTAVFNQLFSVSAQDTSPNGLFFKPDGTKMYVVGLVGADVNEYDLSTAWDISTAVFSLSFSVAAQETFPGGLFFKPDGTKMYVVGSVGDTIHQYSTVLNTASLDLSTGSVFEVTPTTSNLQVSLSNPAASGTSSGATLLLDGVATPGYDLINAFYTGNSLDVSTQDSLPRATTFKPDGTTMYLVGDTGNDINQYSLSTAWDITSAVYVQSFVVTSQDDRPSDVFFKPDGTKMYIVGFGSDAAYQYTLSTAWDISTASYDSVSFSVASQTTTPVSLEIKSDGTKMYVVGISVVYQYSLSTAWDLSTASYDSVSFSVASQESDAWDLQFKQDGTYMYTVGPGSDTVYQYTLSTAWDISTTSYTGISFSVAAQDIDPKGIFFKPDGTKMYVVGVTGDAVYEYSLIVPATITYDTPIQFSGGTAPTAPAIGDTDVLTFNTTDGGTTYKSALAIDGAV